MSQSWCTIESDPGALDKAYPPRDSARLALTFSFPCPTGVFTELIQRIGVKGVQVEEIFELSDQTLDSLQPVHGLIFLFKWVKDDASDRNLRAGGVPGVFFAKQVIQNACATQAIISVLMNAKGVDLGPELSRIKSFAGGLGPEMIGQVIGQDATLRKTHNSFARPEPFMFMETDDKGSDSDDAFHFIGYVPVGNKLYELDGLQPGPIEIGEFKDGKWLQVARPAIEKRIQKYSQKEIRFNLLAIVRNRKDVYESEIKRLETEKQSAPDKKAALDAQIDQFKGKIAQEKSKFDKWAAENVRRKHNFVPFTFQLLKQLAKADKLDAVVEAAQKQAEARMDAQLKAQAAKAKASSS